MVFLRIIAKYLLVGFTVFGAVVGCFDGLTANINGKKQDEVLTELFERYKDVRMPHLEAWIDRAVNPQSQKYLLTMYKVLYEDLLGDGAEFRSDEVNQCFADGFGLLTHREGVLAIQEKMKALGFELGSDVDEKDIAVHATQHLQDMVEQSAPEAEIKKYASEIIAMRFISVAPGEFKDFIHKRFRDDVDPSEELINAIIAFAQDTVAQIQQHLLAKKAQELMTRV